MLRFLPMSLPRTGNQFLNIQEELLISLMDIVRQAGQSSLLPSQTMYLAADSSDLANPLILDQPARGTDAFQPKAVQDWQGWSVNITCGSIVLSIFSLDGFSNLAASVTVTVPPA
jgi:hypothetical protein